MGYKSKRARCRNCAGPYQKKFEEHQFCSQKCRQQFWLSGGVSAAKIEKMVEVQLKKFMGPMESRLAQKFADILRKYRQRVPSELTQMANGNTTDILYSARCMCGEQFTPGSPFFFIHVQGCKVITRP